MHVITTQNELESVLAAFEKSDFVTVDTEFIRETTFWPILCLIQMAAPGVTALIDPLSPDVNLAPFFRLMANEAVVKVFHAARQDIEIIVHLGDLVPHPVFDTQVAAMVCGFGDSVSYDQLVQRITGARLDKSSRFTDWRHRPLSDKQLDYALADVTHLIDVYKHLSAELERENRAHWLNEEMEVLTSRETYDPHPEDAWKRLKMISMSWRAAWNTLVTLSSAISAKKGESSMPSESGSTSADTPGAASWIRHSSGQ